MATKTVSRTGKTDRARNDAEDGNELQEQAEAKQQLAIRNRVRTECFDVLYGAVKAEESVMTMDDVVEYMQALDEDALERAETDAKKMEWLTGLMRHARKFAAETEQVGLDFLARVQSAKKGRFEQASLSRWKKKLKERKGGEKWPNARDRLKDFMRTTLPELKREWDRLDADIDKVHALRARLSHDDAGNAVLRKMDDPSFRTAKFPERRAIVDAALAAVQSIDAETGALYDEARFILDAAAADRLLSPSKVTSALASIFKSSNTLSSIRRYVQLTLPIYRKGWEAECGEFDALETRLSALSPFAAGITGRHSFIALGYAQRASHMRLLRLRVDALEKDAAELKILKHSIHQDLARGDLKSAGSTVRDALKTAPDDEELAALRAHIDAHLEKHDDERDPEEVRKSVHDRVALLPPAVKGLYAAAITEDDKEGNPRAPHMQSVKIMLQNAATLAQNAQPEPEQETQPVIAQEPEVTDAGDAQSEEAPEETTIEQTAVETMGMRTDVTVITMAADEASQQKVVEQMKNLKDDTRLTTTALEIPLPPADRAQVIDTAAALARDVGYLKQKGVSLASEKPKAPVAAPLH